MNKLVENPVAGSLPSVCILMSLYRGEKFLRDQLESIVRQDGVRTHILARDDGSGDATAGAFSAICGALGLSHDLVRGENQGAARSFFTLMMDAPRGYDIYALSDQDDVWNDEKMLRAVRHLKDREQPTLYFCNRAVADDSLNILQSSVKDGLLGFGNALLQNTIQGASAAFNPAGLELIRSIGVPQHVMMHDWWLYLLFSAFGTIVQDDYPGLLYRQHGDNVVGQKVGRVRRYIGHARLHFSKTRMRRSLQVIEFQRLADARLDPVQRALVDLAVGTRTSLISRLRFALSRQIWRQGPDDPIWRALILLGRY